MDILSFLIGLGLIVLVGKILLFPLKLIIKLVFNGLVGGFFLLLFNSLGIGLGIGLAITPLTSLIVGLLGIPGIVLLVLFVHVL